MGRSRRNKRKIFRYKVWVFIVCIVGCFVYLTFNHGSDFRLRFSRIISNLDKKTYDRKYISNINCLNTCPRTKSDSIFLDHGIFAVSINKDTKFANFVAYKLVKENVSGQYKTRKWLKDPFLPEQLAIVPIDYKNAYKICKYDRGHLAPLANFSNNINAYKTNYLSNITPQKSDLNRGTWNDLEKSERILLERFNQVYVLVGVYFNEEEMCYWDKNPRIKFKIPAGYFKLIMIPYQEEIITIGFTFPQNTKKDDKYCDYRSSIKKIEDLTELEFAVHNKELNNDYYKYLGCN